MPAFAKKKYVKLSKGFYGAASRAMTSMIPAVDRSLRYAYISRRLRPRDLRRGWIGTIGSAIQQHNINYSRFANCLTYSNINLNRKILADLCQNQPYSFKAIVDEVKIQNNFQTIQYKRPNYSLDEMVLKNYLIRAKLDDREYEREDKEIKTQYLDDQYKDLKRN